MTVTFFGHSLITENIELRLETVLNELVENGAVRFYVGNQGDFDKLVLKALKKLKERYEHISFFVVLAYLLRSPQEENTVFPEGMETVPPRFAISARNKWMLDNSDCVVSYIKCSAGGAAQFYEMAKKKNKRVINIAETN